MDAIKMIKTRQSNRSFLPYSIDLSIIENIVDCGRMAPSGKNMQPLHFVVIDEREILDKLSTICPYGPFLKDCPIAIAVLGRETDYMVEDASAATENMLLAATAYGLGSCWIGCNNRPHSKEIEKLISCPEDRRIVTLVAIGQIKEKVERRPKKSLAEVMSYNKFE